MLTSNRERDRLFIRLLARSHTDEMSGTHRFMDQLYAGALETFRGALTAVLPKMPESELTWRLHFVVGATSYAMAGRDVLGIVGQDSVMDVNAMEARLVPFLAAGLAAPPAVQRPQSLRRAGS